MSADLAKAVTAIADRLVILASKDAQLRADLRQLAQAVLDATESEEQEEAASAFGEAQEANRGEAEVAPSAGDEEPIAVAEAAGSPGAASPAEPPAPLPELTLGQSAPGVGSPAPSYPAANSTAATTDFRLVERRCRLKAEGARWAATRRRLIADGANFATKIAPVDEDIISRAKAIPDCFLWMCHPTGPSPSNPNLFDEVAGCFEAVADIASVLRQIQDEPDLYRGEFEQVVDLSAEAQSALRVAIATIDGPTDSDQLEVFTWLKEAANENQVFIHRYMRADDPADPSHWSDLASRIEALDSAMQETRRQVKKCRKLLGKVRHKLSLIANEPDDSDGALEHWRILASTVDELVDEGFPPSNRELRELLVPAIDDLPELAEEPRGFRLVLREIDHFMAASPPPQTPPATQPAPEVQEVARLLKDRSLVLIGGDRREGASQALEEAFKLRELIWIEAQEHQPIDSFETYVARPSVAVVVLAIRWCSHSFGNVRDFCERHGKPLVRLPGGYSPNQVAAQIMDQCSEQLKAK